MIADSGDAAGGFPRRIGKVWGRTGRVRSGTRRYLYRF
jgi:hypothetical protein